MKPSVVSHICNISTGKLRQKNCELEVNLSYLVFSEHQVGLGYKVKPRVKTHKHTQEIGRWMNGWMDR